MGAVVVNTTSAALPASFTVGGLPDGATLASVSPGTSAPQSGTAWSCAGLTCQLVDDTGATTPVPAGDGVQRHDRPRHDRGGRPARPTISVTLAGGAPETVGLSLPDGQASIDDTTLDANLSGPSTVIIGTTATAQAAVVNLSAATAPAGATVTVTPPQLDGVTVTPSGAGWSCAQLTCTLDAPIAPSSSAPPLALAIVAAAGIAGGTGTLSFSTQTTLAGAPATASGSLDLTVRPPVSTGVATRLRIDPASAPAGSQVDAVVSVTATGQGLLTDPVSLELQLPEGVTALWDQADVPGWVCSSSTATCTSSGTLTAGEPVIVTVPLDVAADAPRVTAHLEAVATVGTGLGRPAPEAVAGLPGHRPPTCPRAAGLDGRRRGDQRHDRSRRWRPSSSPPEAPGDGAHRHQPGIGPGPRRHDRARGGHPLDRPAHPVRRLGRMDLRPQLGRRGEPRPPAAL